MGWRSAASVVARIPNFFGLSSAFSMEPVRSTDVPELSEWEASSFLSKWTFCVANPMLKLGEKRPLQFDDLLHIPKRYSSSLMVATLREAYRTSTAWWFLPRLLIALAKLMYTDVVLMGVYTLLEAGCMVISPLLLRYLLRALQDSSSAECYMWAAILSGIGLFQVVLHHALFFLSMRVGWAWKNTTTALIHDKLIGMDANKLQSSGASTGMMVNMISNDVARFEEFAVVRHCIIPSSLIPSLT
jgi:ATP-binding cassette subfamily C (CFTR/MRP) protein 4